MHEDENRILGQQVAVLDDLDSPPQRLFRPTKAFYKYISPEDSQYYLQSPKEGYVYPHVDFMKSHYSCAKTFQLSLSRHSVGTPSLIKWSKPCYFSRITSDIMLRDSMALRTEVEFRVVEQMTKLAVLVIQVDVSPPYLEPLLMHKKAAVDHRRFKRREALQIPPLTSTKTTVSKDSNAHWTVRKGEVPISPNIICQFATPVTPKTISSQEALQWTFLSAMNTSFLSDRLTLSRSTSCKIEIDFVTTTVFIRVADAISGRSLEEKIKLSSITLSKYAREDLLRMEFELLDKKEF